MARFTETVNIQQAPTVSFDATPLTRRLNEFTQKKNAEIAQKTAETSFTKGQESFKKGEEPEFKEIGFFTGISSKAYNQGLRSSYLASLDRDNREEIAKLSVENSSNLIGFNEKVSSYRASVLKSVEPDLAATVSESLDSLISSNRIKVQSNEIRKNHAENDIETASHLQTVTDDALAFARDGNDIGAAESALTAFSSIDGRVASGFMTKEQGAIAKREVEKGITEEKLRGDLFRKFDDEGEQAAFDELDGLSDKVKKGFSPEEWDSFISKAQTDLNRKSARQRQQLKANVEAEKLDNSIKRGFLFTNPDIPADPAKSSQDRKDVNNYYESVAPAWQGSTNEIINQNVKFVQDTGIVPNQLISNMNASMRSGNDQHVLTMMELMQRLQESSPNVMKDFPDESRSVSLQVSDSMRNGLDSAQAVEIARKNTFGLTKTEKETLKLKASEVDVSKNFQEMVDDKLDPFTGFFGFLKGAPDIPPGMEASYKSNFDDFMVMTNGNAEQAEKLAFDTVQNVWGFSETGGPARFMRYAPESFYHVDGFDDVWVENQFLEDMENLGIEDAVIGVDGFVPRSDSPSYPIMAPNADGILDIIEDENGEPLRFQPDFKATQDYKDLIDSPDKAIETAAQKRDRELKRRSGQVFRLVSSRAASPSFSSPDKREFLKSEEGKEQVRSSVSNLLALEKIDAIEARETLEAFDAGTLEDLAGFDIFVERGLIRADR